jgi:uncharacterized membrane protein
MTDPIQPPSAPTQGFEFNSSTIVALLYFASFVTGITAIIGVVWAYLKRDEVANSWESSHLAYHIGTFWKGLMIAIGLFLSMITIILIPVAWIGFVALAVWYIVRSLKALLAAQKHEPIGDPATWLI